MSAPTFLSGAYQALQYFIFPPICLYCHVSHEEPARFCTICQQLFEFISFYGRCRRCFRLKRGSKGPSKGCCYYCLKHPLSAYRSLTLFESFGPPLTLIDSYDAHAKAIAALIIIRLSTLPSWPWLAYIWATAPLRAAAHLLCKLTSDHTRWINLRSPPLGQAILFLTLYPSEEELPPELIPNKIYHIALLTSADVCN